MSQTKSGGRVGLLRSILQDFSFLVLGGWLPPARLSSSICFIFYASQSLSRGNRTCVRLALVLAQVRIQVLGRWFGNPVLLICCCCRSRFCLQVRVSPRLALPRLASPRLLGLKSPRARRGTGFVSWMGMDGDETECCRSRPLCRENLKRTKPKWNHTHRKLS